MTASSKDQQHLIGEISRLIELIRSTARLDCLLDRVSKLETLIQRFEGLGRDPEAKSVERLELEYYTLLEYDPSLKKASILQLNRFLVEQCRIGLQVLEKHSRERTLTEKEVARSQYLQGQIELYEQQFIDGLKRICPSEKTNPDPTISKPDVTKPRR